jgi:threonine aldolase
VHPERSFASDNNSGVHPDILRAIERANSGHCIAYGDDPFTGRAVAACRRHFGDTAEVYFVLTGTGANVLSVRCALQSYESVICSTWAHLDNDECAAPENFTGCKLTCVPAEDGKLSPEAVRPLLEHRGDPHRAQPRLISVTQPTELGTVYTAQELHAIADFAHSEGMYLHMDGGLREITADVGVDILSFGGTKNGMMIGEAVIIFNHDLGGAFAWIRKQGMQLLSKMRFLSAQFEAFLTGGLWLENARRSYEMAQLLASEIGKLPGCIITQKVESNAVFVSLPLSAMEEIRRVFFFYLMGGRTPSARFMTSFDTQEEDIYHLIHAIKTAIGNCDG